MSIPVFNPLQSDWLMFPVVLAGIFAVIGLAEILMKQFRWSGESSRRIVHVLVGILICGTVLIFESKYPVMALCIIFTGVNLATLQSQKFQGMHKTSRVSYGTVYYPVSIFILTLFFWNSNPMVYLLSILFLAIGDPVASLTGESVDAPKSYQVWRDEKTIQGSSSLAAVIFLLTFAGMLMGKYTGFNSPEMGSLVIIAISAALTGTAAESISSAGSDNLSLPLLTAVILDVMLRMPDSGRFNLLIWIFITLIVVAISYRLQFLQLSGTVAAFLLGSFVFGIGGLPWMVPMAIFFGLSSLLSKLGKRRKSRFESVYEKTENRDMMQVLANAGLAFPMVILWFYTGDHVFYLAYLGGLAAATADTWATELGAFSSAMPRHIVNLKPVARGTSGGVSWLGSFSALLGAAVLTASGWISAQLWMNDVIVLSQLIIVLSAGFAASLLDSLLGATIQGQFTCEACEQITEKRSHCGTGSAQLHHGITWVNNDVVNFLCTLFGVTAVLLLQGF